MCVTSSCSKLKQLNNKEEHFLINILTFIIMFNVFHNVTMDTLRAIQKKSRYAKVLQF